MMTRRTSSKSVVSQYGHTKIFFRAGILGLMEEIRDVSKYIFFFGKTIGIIQNPQDRINDLVSMMQVELKFKTHLRSNLFSQGVIRAYYARRIYKRLWDHKRGLLVAQHAIRGYMIGKQWLWWNLWLALK